METTTPDQNGGGYRAAKRTAEDNLTFLQNVVRHHPGIDALPGYVLAVFEKRGKGGAIFTRLVKPGERSPSIFKIPLLDWAKNYLAIAVNDQLLTYSFDHSIALDGGTDLFKLNFHLTYRVADPQKVAEIWELDPLRQLCGEIGRVIGRNCAKRKPEMFRDRFRDLEKIVVDSESVRLRTYATTLGFKIVSIDLEKLLSAGRIGVIETRYRVEDEKNRFGYEQDLSHTKREAARADSHRMNIENVHHKYDIQQVDLQRQIELSGQSDEVHRTQQKRRLREIETDAIGQALINVGAGIHTPDALREGFETAREISTGIQSDNRGSALPAALSSGPAPLAIGSGEDRLSNLLALGIREVDRWTGTFAQKQALRSNLLHIVAEALLDDHADEKTLKLYANKLSELGKGFQPPLGRTQRLFLEKFMNIDELKNNLR
jgi:hypothetical protein